MNAIEAVGLIKRFSGKTVLEDIHMEVGEGTVFGLLGPSGAGKTTLIKILTGQLVPDGGEARLFGERCLGLYPSAFGVMMDNAGLYDRLNAFDNLKLFCKIHGLPDSRAMEALSEVGLQDASRTVAGKLSKGMRQRLMLARAALHHPKILFLDEPTASLDPAMAGQIHSLIRTLCRGGATIFLTTHNMEEAHRLCGRVALLNGGRIVEAGIPEELCRKYNTQNEVKLLKRDGREVVLANSPESACEISRLFEKNEVAAIHSTEPDLESVFLLLTGRRLA